MRVIYEPKGRAGEYCPLAVNLYNGCAHRCRYCYVPGIRRQTREAFAADVRPRPRVIEFLERDAKELARRGERRPVFLCFMCDPYQEAETEHMLTRRALEILGREGLAARVLTKNPMLAERDFDLFRAHRFELGVTLVFCDDRTRAEWEPSAPPTGPRMDAIRRLHGRGVRTWVSLEPVICPKQTLEIVESLHRVVDHWRVGKLNHDRKLEDEIDRSWGWRGFLAGILAAFRRHGSRYYIKQDLWAFADDAIRAEFPRSRGLAEETAERERGRASEGSPRAGRPSAPKERT